MKASAATVDSMAVAVSTEAIMDFTVAKDFDVIGVVGELAQRLDGLPDGHVHDDKGVVTVRNVRGVSGFRLQPPDKSRSLVRESVDRLQLRDEFGDFRIVKRSDQACNVDLREMIVHSGLQRTPFQRRFRNRNGSTGCST